MPITQKRAKVGGETGTNGEFYEGGKFLPSTERAKGKAKKRGARKVQIENYVWITMEPGDERRAILTTIGAQTRWVNRYDGSTAIEPNPPGIAYYGDTWLGWTIDELCELWNRGERLFMPR